MFPLLLRIAALLRHPFALGIGGALVLALLAVQLQSQGLFQRWGNAFYDVELGLFARPVHDDIVIVAIDEYSLGLVGRWPWPRRIHAQLLAQLQKLGAQAAAIDVVFSEPDANDIEGDQMLATALKQYGRVVLPVLAEKPRADAPLAAVRPLPLFANAAVGLGHTDIEPGEDGVVRSVYLQAGTHQERWPALALALLKAADARSLPDGLRDLGFDANAPFSGQWQRQREIYIPFVTQDNAFKQVSYADVLLRRLSVDALRGKLVLVGATAAGLAPVFAIPDKRHARLVSGVHVHANILDALMRKLVLQPLAPFSANLLTFFLVFGAACSYSLLRQPWQGLLSAVLFCILAVTISAVLFKAQLRWYSPALAILGIAVSYPIWSWGLVKKIARSLLQERQRAEATLRAIGDAVVSTDTNGDVEYLNLVAEKMSGCALSEAKGRPIGQVFPVAFEDRAISLQDISRQLQDGHAVNITSPGFLHDAAGNGYALRVCANPIKDRRGQVFGHVYAFNDISKLLQASHEMAYMASYDPLTGLLNRGTLQNRLSQAIISATRSGDYLAVLFVEVQGIKGSGVDYECRDSILQETAKRLLACVGEGDMVGRWHGEEFVVVLVGDVDKQRAAHCADSIMQALSRPYAVVVCCQLPLGANIGISLHPQDGLGSEALLTRANQALHGAHGQSLGQCHFFSDC